MSYSPPTPPEELPDVEDSEWTLTKRGLRTASYTQPAPDETDYDYLRLVATTNRVYLEGARNDEPHAHHDHVPVPIPNALPDDCASQSDRQTNVVATALTPLLIEATIERPVGELLEATRLSRCR